MTVEDIKNNLEKEKNILLQISSILETVPKTNSQEGNFYLRSLKSLQNQLTILNKAIPNLLEEISPLKELNPGKKTQSNKLVKVSYTTPSEKEKNIVSLKKEDKEKFAKELSLFEGFSKKTKNPEITKTKKFSDRSLINISTKMFGGISNKLSSNLPDLKKDISQANMPILLRSYIALSILIVLSTFIFSSLIFTFLLLLGLNVLGYFWIVLLVPILVSIFLYLYPSLEKGNVEKGISYELPFATIYLAAIAGSEIEPTKLFRIISSSPEYPFIGKEILKVLNQVEIYGYDLVTALKNIAKKTPNRKLAELFGGLAMNIVSGGSLKNFLEKKSKNLLQDYRLERQKYSAIAGTFMDVYISVLITAPLILMMILTIMNITNIGGGISINFLMFTSIVVLVLINAIFLAILNFKQPKT